MSRTINLYVRHISEDEAVRPCRAQSSIPVAHDPAFSPDGRSIAFYAPGDQTIKTVAVSGRNATDGRAHRTAASGMSWSGDEIFVGQGAAGILRLSADGGGAETVVKVGAGRTRVWPAVAARRRARSCSRWDRARRPDRWDRAAIVVQSLRSGARKMVIAGGSDARYLPTGHIAYMMGGIVFAVRFDTRQARNSRNARSRSSKASCARLVSATARRSSPSRATASWPTSRARQRALRIDTT